MRLCRVGIVFTNESAFLCKNPYFEGRIVWANTLVTRVQRQHRNIVANVFNTLIPMICHQCHRHRPPTLSDASTGFNKGGARANDEHKEYSSVRNGRSANSNMP